MYRSPRGPLGPHHDQPFELVLTFADDILDEGRAPFLIYVCQPQHTETVWRKLDEEARVCEEQGKEAQLKMWDEERRVNEEVRARRRMERDWRRSAAGN